MGGEASRGSEPRPLGARGASPPPPRRRPAVLFRRGRGDSPLPAACPPALAGLGREPAPRPAAPAERFPAASGGQRRVCKTRRTLTTVFPSKMAACDGFANARGGAGRLCEGALAAYDGFAGARRASRPQTRRRPPREGGFPENARRPICKPVASRHFEDFFWHAALFRRVNPPHPLRLIFIVGRTLAKTLRNEEPGTANRTAVVGLFGIMRDSHILPANFVRDSHIFPTNFVRYLHIFRR